MRFDSQLSRMNCQTFSTGLSSGHFDGSGSSVMLAGTRGDGGGDLGEVERHALGIAAWQHQPGCLALGRANGTVDIG